MALVINVHGLAVIRTGTGVAGALEDLGYTHNGAIITLTGHYIDVKGDENGGDDGPPVDIQFLGETARIRIELYKYDPTVASSVSARVNGAVAGVPSTPGTLMFQDSKAIRLLIDNATHTNVWNFPRAFARDPIEINRGTKFSTLIFEFEAYKDGSGNLYNQTYA